MKTILLTFVLLSLAQASFACDEACKRDQVEAAKNLKFPTYVNQKYCQTTTEDFLLRARKSLQQYRDNQLSTGHRGGAKNIRNFILQRRDWLQECESYMEAMDLGFVFRQKDTTDKIFGSMGGVADSLYKMMMRPKNPEESLNLVTAPVAQKFDDMFKLIDQHFLELQKRGLI